MSNKPPIISFVVLIATLFAAGCAGPGVNLEPYEYTHTTEIKRFEIYENERIKEAERLVVVTLEQLGYNDLTISRNELETPTIEFTLPDDATQGPDTWYIMNFHFLVEFEEDTGGGFCDVTAKPGDSVQFEVMRVNDSPYIHVGKYSSDSVNIEVRYHNYMMTSGIKPGINKMVFQLKEYQGARIKSITVYGDTAIEVTSTAPNPPEQEANPNPDGFEPFCSVSPELTARLEQICLDDPRIHELIKDRKYSFTVDGKTIAGKDYNLALGVRLKEDIASQRFNEWMEGGQQDSELIREYVGVLKIGYSETYDIVIDIENEVVAELTKRESNGSGIPEVTAEEKQRAVEIALADTTLKQILEGKEYQIAPEGEIGVWHSGDTKLGVVFEIQFDKRYEIDSELPRYQGDAYHHSGEVKSLTNSVLLEENRVATIIAISLPPPMN